MANDDLEYARKKINLARVEESEIFPTIQSLSLKEQRDDICLLQLNPEILKQIAEGNTLTIRGDPDDSAVLCTESRTFEIKEAETSNSLLLVPELVWPEDFQSEVQVVVSQNVTGVYHNYYELRPYKPSFQKLRALLEASAYRGKEYEDSDVHKFTLEQLLDIIQASKEELSAELVRQEACTLDGFVRVLDFSYKFDVFSCILNAVESQSIPLDKIPKAIVMDSLKDLHPMEILEQCFSWFTADADSSDNEEKLYKLTEKPVCILYAEVLLRTADKFVLQDFLNCWKRSVPEGMTCSLDQLRGMALTDTNSRPESIFYYPSHNLPEIVKERFEILFRMKEKWSYDEIYSYLEDRAYAGNDVKALLIKYTRESTKDGVKFYSSKW